MARSETSRRVPRPRDLRVASLPTTLPVFPLAGALLLPRGKLPLNIFEPRYLALIEDVLAGDRLFGMIQPVGLPDEQDAEQDDEPDTDETPHGLYTVGCVGRLVSFTERDDGTCSIALSGVARFRTRQELPELRGYRRLEVEYREFGHDIDESDDIALDRTAAMTALRRFFVVRGFEARWDAIEQMDDETLITTISMVCPFPPAEKQALLEAPTWSDRARILVALLQMAGHETQDGGNTHAA